jgi:hypothetical protein
MKLNNNKISLRGVVMAEWDDEDWDEEEDAEEEGWDDEGTGEDSEE